MIVIVLALMYTEIALRCRLNNKIKEQKPLNYNNEVIDKLASETEWVKYRQSNDTILNIKLRL